MATGFNVRVGDAERDAVAAQLRDHYADGRLTLDELNERLDLAFAAKTKADLNEVMRDLPHVARPTAGATAGGSGTTGGQLGLPGSAWNYGSADDGRRSGGSYGRPFAPVVLALVWMCVIIGSLFLFGIGGGDRPIAVVLIIAAIAFLRRLFGGGRRRGSGPRGRRGPKGSRRR
jgi:Domain of unknown function (DUF1707)